MADTHPRLFRQGWLRPLAWIGHRWRMRGPLLRLPGPPGRFQPDTFTMPGRMPACFAHCRAALGDGDGAGRAILSFGCSTGEEIHTIAQFLPAARITGIDINPRAIAQARAAMPPDLAGRVRLSVAADAAAEEDAAFDAIFAMAVFRHSGLKSAPARCDRLLDFADFERVATGLARTLKPGGMLYIVHAHFRFGDTAIARGFDVVLTREPGPGAEPNPLYGADNRLLSFGVAATDIGWRKRG